VESADVPDGAMVVVDGAACLVAGGDIFEWSWDGYRARGPLPRGPVDLLTPPLTARALHEGYAVVTTLG
jgi:hypothetical protein